MGNTFSYVHPLYGSGARGTLCRMHANARRQDSLQLTYNLPNAKHEQQTLNALEPFNAKKTTHLKDIMQDIKDKASRGLRKAGNALGIESKATEESNAMDDLSDMCPKLTYQQVRYDTVGFIRGRCKSR